MQVKWSYEGLSYRHTVDEIDDPECHTWQPPMDADELIIHAANLHLYRTGGAAPSGANLWSLTRKAGQPLPEEPKRTPAQ